MKKLTVAALIAGPFALAFATFAPTYKLTLDGQVVTTEGTLINGRLFVPADSIAKALGKSYTYKPGSTVATIDANGGQFQATGAEGKTGSWLFNGRTRVMLGTSFEDLNDRKVISLEVRNAEPTKKGYNFGFQNTKYTLYDADGNSIEGNIVSDDYYSYDIQPATMKRIQVKYRFTEGFKPVRMVLSLQTQISGHPPKDEIFRISLVQ